MNRTTGETRPLDRTSVMGRSIIDIARDKKLLTEKEIEEILDPVSMTEPQYPKDAAKRREDIKKE